MLWPFSLSSIDGVLLLDALDPSSSLSGFVGTDEAPEKTTPVAEYGYAYVSADMLVRMSN
jgi:hypothetical protein